MLDKARQWYPLVVKTHCSEREEEFVKLRTSLQLKETFLSFSIS